MMGIGVFKRAPDLIVLTLGRPLTQFWGYFVYVFLGMRIYSFELYIALGIPLCGLLSAHA